MSIPAALLEVVARTRRLALGIAPQDALLRDGLVAPIRIDIETAIPHEAAPLVGMSHQQLAGRRPGGLLRHPSGRYSLSYYPGIATEVTLRLTDHERIYVPRRLRVPLVTLAVVQAREAAEAPGYLAGRVRRPVLHPGAAYPIMAATGLRAGFFGPTAVRCAGRIWNCATAQGRARRGSLATRRAMTGESS